jgi:hypothetical protein
MNNNTKEEGNPQRKKELTDKVSLLVKTTREKRDILAGKLLDVSILNAAAGLLIHSWTTILLLHIGQGC